MKCNQNFEGVDLQKSHALLPYIEDCLLGGHGQSHWSSIVHNTVSPARKRTCAKNDQKMTHTGNTKINLYNQIHFCKTDYYYKAVGIVSNWPMLISNTKHVSQKLQL